MYTFVCIRFIDILMCCIFSPLESTFRLLVFLCEKIHCILMMIIIIMIIIIIIIIMNVPISGNENVCLNG
uniref:G-protein coupled receptors family 1 profile domain-containing protein n=1 Tax=Anguilla anguilla TaxID=7936 RepID=A0A0E9RY26_ANGAN